VLALLAVEFVLLDSGAQLAENIARARTKKAAALVDKHADFI
jgi:hypothetical protein